MKLEAVIFDMDGLLVDTESADFEAWQELYRAHGHDLNLDEYCCHAGRYGSWDRLYAHLSDRTGHHPDDLHEQRLPRYRELVDARLQPSSALTTLVAQLRAAGILRGIASASDRDWVDYLLDGLGLRHEFHSVLTGDDVPKRKPAPDVYIAVLEAMQVEATACVALEDSATGIEAARGAGLTVIAVPNPISRRQDLSAAHHQVNSLGDLSLEVLRALLRS